MPRDGVNSFLNNASKVTANKKVILEVNIEDEFVKYAESLKCQAYKLTRIGHRGFPDRTIFTPEAGIFFIEFKKKGKDLRATQKPVKRLLTALGFKYYLCDKQGQAEKILNQFLKNHI